VFVLLAEATPGDGAVAEVGTFRVAGLDQLGPDEPWLLVSRLTDSAGAVEALALSWFADLWAAAGNLVVAAAGRWGDLAGHGVTFFGGSRNRDGTFRWHTAECDTDGEGIVLRY
jgi:hypothetical protein